MSPPSRKLPARRSPVRKGATTPTTSTVPLSLTPIPTGYRAWLAALKADIRATQLRASVAVNRELVLMYWRIGRDILERQAKDGWGSKVVDRIARDLNAEFPDMRGFSSRNLQYMRAFAEAWPDAVIVQQAAAQLPWFHLCTLKAGEFRPEHAGKLNLYLSAADSLLRQPPDNPTM